ncbi:hypothetical protein A9K97_gp216 [Tokyovirus A1]|uniref:hypothetical protein n=1 Tax=Tokyovirus A1 TaxID=1826170 RepID=UPI0007A98297|nr:hypothetical protein A9K97_gp216 [Tokyovirus A1]BAU80135.1 hypothetical protein [Tokyovirus A1]
MMDKIFVEQNNNTHADVLLPRTNVTEMLATASFSGFKGKKKIFIVVTLEGVLRPWRSSLMEVKLSKKESHWMGEISPKDFFDKRHGVAPHVCVRLVDAEGKQLKNAGQWSMTLEF